MLRTLIAAAFLASPAAAATLDFEGDVCDGGVACFDGAFIDQGYGDIAGIDVVYDRDVDSGGPADGLSFWAGSYSDLANVAWGGSSDDIGRPSIRFLATGSSAVSVTGFDFGAYPNTDRETQYSIIDLATGTVLFASPQFTVSGTTATNVAGLWTSSVGIEIQWGPNGYNVGIDNVEYGLATAVPPGEIPLPAGLPLLALGVGGLALLRRRR